MEVLVSDPLCSQVVGCGIDAATGETIVVAHVALRGGVTSELYSHLILLDPAGDVVEYDLCLGVQLGAVKGVEDLAQEVIPRVSLGTRCERNRILLTIGARQDSRRAVA